MIYSVFDAYMTFFTDAYSWSIGLIPDSIFFVSISFIITFLFLLSFLFIAMAFVIITCGIPLFIMYKIYKGILNIFSFLAEETSYHRYTLRKSVKRFFKKSFC